MAAGEIPKPIVVSSVPIDEILAVALSFSSAVALAWLSFLEHRRSVQPSTLICLYLLASVTNDLYLVISPGKIYHKFGPFPFLNTLFAQIILKTILLVVECRIKKPLLLVDSRDYAETDLVGVLNRVTFWWINPILKLGNKRILTADNMPLLDAELSTQRIRDRAVQQWNDRGLYVPTKFRS